QSLPFGDLWTERQKARLEGTDHWIGALCALLLPTVEAYEELFEEVVTAAPYAAAGMASVQSDKDFLTRVRQGLQDADWDRVCEIVTGYKFPTAARITKNPTDAEEIYREYRKKMKDFFQKEVFTLTAETCRSDLESLRPALIFLIDAVREHRRRVLEEMRRRNAYGFSQLSDLALNLLVEDYSYEDGTFTPSPIALREREEYDEILIDEYQDTNDLQDLMFRAVSRDNCFAVGDVKQGIYGFRGANPANFLRKKDDSKVIVLNRNFRSRAGILDYANFLFRGLFSPLLGGIVYDESEALIPGRSADEGDPYPARHAATLLPTQDFPPPREREGREPDTELLLLPCESKTDEDCALLCAKLIRDAVDGGATVFDKGEKTVRPLRYSDVAILLRSTKNAVEIYEEVFRTCGIPLLSSEGQTFLDTPEVCGVLAFLRTINDPWDNIALFVTLTGNLFSLTPEQVAELRLRAPKSYLWEGLCEAAKEDERAQDVLRQINRFRILAQNLPIPKLLWEIYTATDYLALESATDSQARSNLMKFYSFACRYSGSGGLCGFLEFADRARLSGKVREAGSAPDGDFVRIMTIHKSKGLEFAWCILPELEHKLGGVRDKISVDTQFGIAPKLKNPAGTAEYTTLMRETLELKQTQESISEELRVLYVGLTRARDRMTLISRTNADPDKMLAHAYHTKDGAVRLPTLLGAQNYAQMILDRTANHPDAKVLHSIAPEEATLPLRVSYVGVPEAVSPVTEGKKTECGLSPEELSARFDYRYDDYLSAVPAKVSVTEIAKVPADPDSALLLEEPPVTKPKFPDETALTATERGTALHTFCQFADFDRP
ncbi:MAG: UvrD-helicase domain-containing protein, partial [Clostridia bacterium]|nr:UvrD-helicase domain-containing protein [Clostridia bacterium]